MDTPLRPEQMEPIRQAVLAGQKIQAIKLYREATSSGLAEAKRAVEDLEIQWRASHNPGPLPPLSVSPTAPNVPPGALTPEQMAPIREAVLAGNKILAIKYYREATNLGLAESKHAVEDLERQWRAAAPPPVVESRKRAAKPAESKPFARAGKGSGCFSSVILVGAAFGVMLYVIVSR